MSEFERWQSRFAAPGYIFGEAPNAFLAAQASRLPQSGRALAIADGEGRNGVFLAERGLETTSLDLTPNGQSKAAALARKRGVDLRLIEADVHAWPWPLEAFDVIADIFTQFSEPADRAKKFAGMKRALKPGGLLLMQAYRPEQLGYGTGGPKQVDHLYTKALLEKAFGDFAELSVREHDSETSEGHAHVGMAALIDLIGVK